MRRHGPFLLFLAVWLGGNLLFLDRFPFVHSDEPWLSGLSRAMLESGSPAATEPFFDLKPRHPHAIKSLFHLLQMPFLLLFGHQVFAFRLLSLLAGGACLALFRAAAHRATGSGTLGLLAAALLGCDIQFVYAAHFARQEILILLVMLGCYLLLTARPGSPDRAPLYAAILTGLAIGVHPNAFVVACLCGALLLLRVPGEGRLAVRALAVYAGVTGVFAALFVGASLAMDRDFFVHYPASGVAFLVHSSLAAKIRETVPYLQRLFYRVSGTYYTPDIRLQLLLFPAVICAAAVFVPRRGMRFAQPLAAVAGIWAGMALVGRFSQPYVVFFFPFCWLLFTTLLGKLGAGAARAGMVCAVLAVGGLCAAQAYPITVQSHQYSRYLAAIADVVPPGAKTLANLNAGYHFSGNALRDWRNVPYCKSSGLSLAEYIRQNEVEYIIVPDELQLIYDLRPAWNGVYGPITFLPELNALLARCVLRRAFIDNQYGIRVTRFQNTDRDFTVRMYHCPRP